MEEMLVVVFDNEAKAYEAVRSSQPTRCRGEHHDPR